MTGDFTIRKVSLLKGSFRPDRWLFIDTETKQLRCPITKAGMVNGDDHQEYLFKNGCLTGIKHRMKIGWTCYSNYEKDRGFFNDRWEFWQNSEKLWRYVETLCTETNTLYLVGHNIYFDLQSSDFFYWFTKWGWSLEFYYDKSLIYILAISKGKQRIKCLSSTNFFPFSLAVLGDMLNMPKGEVDFDKVSRSDLITYCKRDVAILHKAVASYIRFIDDNDLGKFKLTRASQAFTAYRYRFMGVKVYMHKDEKTTELEESGYFGGRVESRFLGIVPGKSFIHLDVNSLYPYVMKTNPVPVKLIEYGVNISIDRMGELLRKYCCMASVELSSDDPAYAVRHNGKTVFPTGCFTTTLSTPGLLYALKNDHIKAIGNYSVYLADYIFTDYVNMFYKLKLKYKKTGNKVMQEIAKNFLNYLYGKFAQKRDCIEMIQDLTYDGYFREIVYDLVTGENEVTTKMFNCVWRTYGKEPSKVYIAAIAAHITEYARFHLYYYMQKLGVKNVIYCDTDSLKIKSCYLRRLQGCISDNKLGLLKIEDRSKQLSIFGAKHYTTEHTVKIKGVPSSATKIGDYKYRYTKFYRQTHHLRNQVTRYFITQEVTKTAKPFYDKGVVNDNGVITPFVF